MGESGAMILWKGGSKLEGRIEDYENEFGVKLPDCLKQIIIENNWATPVPATFKLPSGEEDSVKHLLSFNKRDKGNAFFCKRLEQIPADVYPFAVDPFGSFICLQDSHVVFFDSETESCEPLSPSVSEFFERLY